MSFFQRLLGGSKKEDPNNISSADAIQRLSSVEEILVKKQAHLESQIDAEKANALRCSKAGNRRGALLALKKKKKFEKTLSQLDGTLTTLEAQRESLQDASSNMEVLTAMRQAANALKKSNQGLDADSVHDLMDDLAEQHHIAEEIGTAISAPGIGASDLYNDADLERELQDLAEENDRDEMLKIGPLPDVPITTPTINNKRKEKDDDLLRQLEAWAE